MAAPGDAPPPVVYTMENKPIVTCAGDQSLFSAVYPTLSLQLPREPMEWRRSYGRAPKMIHLESNFVQFREELLPQEGNRALLTFPFLHIYWTECCDAEAYKAVVRDDLTKWQSALKAHGSTDWLIVVVENDAKKKNKTNILPRTSIVDKIRNDFCNKQSDRCVVLSDPLKDSSRTQESWNAFLTKLRTLLLMSFTKNLGKFEDDMRTLREKRTEPGWSFCEYFMVQEELAFVFEMLQQFEDALVQYDELDALFSQYVVNFGAGDGANWLAFFCQPVKSWSGLALRKPIDMEKRELVRRREATLLDLRSYLFSRQCTLLLFLQRPWEVAQRALGLLHSCVQELRLLEVSVPPGALDCWVFLSCLEVLQRIEGCCERAQLDANVSHTVGLWSYATEKLKSLGYLCGLISENGPDSEDLNRTVDLLAGLGTERPETANTAQSPYKKLKEALSSVEAFEKHYLDLAQATMEMYSSIGRSRSAKLVGKDLAEFHMRKRSPQKAELYLQGALKSYVAEGWALPITHTRKQLAACQKLLGQVENYLQTSSLLASDGHLPEEERRHFCQELLGFAGEQTGSPGRRILLPMESFVQLQELSFRPAGGVVHVGGVLTVDVRLSSRMPTPLPLEQLGLRLHFSAERPGVRGMAEGQAWQRATGPVRCPPPAATRGGSPTPELHEVLERSPSDGAPASASIICRNVHLLLRAPEPGPVPTPDAAPAGLALEDGPHTLRCGALTLEPGPNLISFQAQAMEPGTYTLRQLCAWLGPVCFLLPRLPATAQYDVYSQEPQLRVEPLTDSLLAGIPQKVRFTVTTGHYTVKSGDSLQLSNAEAMLTLCCTDSRARVYSSSREKASEAMLRVQASDKVTSIGLPAAPAYHVIEFELDVLSLPCVPEASEDTSEAVRPPCVQDPQKAEPHMATTDHKVSIDCPWSIYSTVIALTFSMPFQATHTLLSAGTRKYVQVCVQNLSDLDFQLSESRLEDVGHSADLRLVPLHTQALQHMHSRQTLFFVWELTWGRPPPGLRCSFSLGFRPAAQERLSMALQPYTYNFRLEGFFTLYTVSAEIRPPPGCEHCRTGALCSLEVAVTRLSDLLEVDRDEALTEAEDHVSTRLLYEVVDNSSNWAVCGKSSGVIAMPVAAHATHRVHMEVMPLFAGCLPLPAVRLFKYLPHHSASASAQLDADSWIENDSVSLDRPADEDGGSLRSRGSAHSAGSGEHKGLPMPRLQALPPGQVFNASAGQQVLVVPSGDDHVLEVSVT